MQQPSPIRVERHRLKGVEVVSVDSIAPGLKRGDIFVVRECLQAAGVFDELRSIIFEAIEEVSGPDVRRRAQAEGLRRLHEMVPVEALTAMHPVMTKRTRALAPRLVEAVAQSLLGLGAGVHFEDGPNIRIFCPEDCLAPERDRLERFKREVGGGRLTLHGPHQDDRHFHPVGAINFWCALDRIETGNGMNLYPDCYGELLPCNEADGNARPDQYFGSPLSIALNPGDAWIFETLHMHASTINQTMETRFAISFRLTTDLPRFREKVWYNYVRPADCTEEGPPKLDIDYSTLPGRGPTTLDTSSRRPARAPALSRWDGSLQVASEVVRESEIRPLDERFCISRIDGKPVVFQRRCPHEGADLSAGAVVDGQIVCPWHGLRFSAADGRSGCRTISALRLLPCEESAGEIVIETEPTEAVV
jgi:nitrite reductase/ring-hydroxylating ferredoxin subunit